MKWKRERDLLVAQTLAFVQSVAGKKGDPTAVTGYADSRNGLTRPASESPRLEAVKPASESARTFVSAPSSDARLPGELSTPKPSRAAAFQTAGPHITGGVRAEMQARVASFLAHQERFNRDRDQYYTATFARLRAAMEDGPATPPPSK
jgi:hypothetical protein